MNSQVIKLIRKWSRLRELDYSICKQMYLDSSMEDKIKMMNEVKEYISAVDVGLVIPGKPKLEEKVIN